MLMKCRTAVAETRSVHQMSKEARVSEAYPIRKGFDRRRITVCIAFQGSRCVCEEGWCLVILKVGLR
jgi:hypothetical protein